MTAIQKHHVLHYKRQMSSLQQTSQNHLAQRPAIGTVASKECTDMDQLVCSWPADILNKQTQTSASPVSQNDEGHWLIHLLLSETTFLLVSPIKFSINEHVTVKQFQKYTGKQHINLVQLLKHTK
jgi:hypothetical protein